jgi:hypothetical protein
MPGRTIRLCCLLFSMSLSSTVVRSSESEPPIDFSLAEQYFQEAQAICRADSGKLWGVSLCGPIMFVEPNTF